MPGARDGQLRIHRGTDSPPWAIQIFDDDLGLWLTLAQAHVEDDLMLAGVPILRGPYVVDFNRIPHDGDTMTLWTPEVGDVLLRLFVDWQTVTQWDNSNRLGIGQLVDGAAPKNEIVFGYHGNIAGTDPTIGVLDNIIDAMNTANTNGSGLSYASTAYVFHTADPVQIQMFGGSTDPTQGHVELYALLARAVMP